MDCIRRAKETDLARIAEIEIFNYRLNFYPIFRNDDFYIDELSVPVYMEDIHPHLERMFVYDDGVVKGFISVDGRRVDKLFVEPVLQGKGIGARLLDYAVQNLGADELWALEKNERAIAFYSRHGFRLTADKKPEEDTSEFLVRLKR